MIHSYLCDYYMYNSGIKHSNSFSWYYKILFYIPSFIAGLFAYYFGIIIGLLIGFFLFRLLDIISEKEFYKK